MLAERSEIGREILLYLSEHPQAQDTIEGIVEWWLLENEIRHEIAMVQAAVDELVAKGLVAVSIGSDSRNRYHVKHGIHT